MNFEILLKSPSFLAFQKAIQSGESILFESLWDTPKALVAAFTLWQTKKNILLITGGTREDRLFENLDTLTPQSTIEFPAWETLPGEEIAPSPDIIGKRFEALRLLLSNPTGLICLCPLQSLLQKIIPKEQLAPLFSIWKRKLTIDFLSIPERLKQIGYRPVSIVSDKGQFAIRGGIVDLFPVSSPDPFRVEFWGDTIEEIRIFDPAGQKSIRGSDEVIISPAQELLLLQKATRFSSILDYLGQDTIVIWDDIVAIEDTYVAIKKMPGSQSPFFYSMDEVTNKLKGEQNFFGAPDIIENLSTVHKNTERTGHFQSITFETINHTFHAKRWFHSFSRPSDFFPPTESEKFIDILPKELTTPTLFFNTSDIEETDIRQELEKNNITLSEKVSFERGYLTTGFAIADLPLVLIPNCDFTNRTHVRRQKWRSTTHTPIAEFHQLALNDLVVHFHSGIGRYRGTEKHVNHLGQETEFLIIEYAENSKLFVPMSQSYLVSRYIGTYEETPSLSQLGSKRWQNTRLAAQQQIVGYASDLLQMYAERAVQGGYRFPPNSELTIQFAREFPYTETSDQLAAIAMIESDMTSEKPMDRLICGDVGYGKTEVAMRAAFKAVVDGHKQVAVLVPTTVLAMQHYETFSERMRGFPVQVGVVSRFQTLKQNQLTLDKIKIQEIDILIGTHRLLSKDVEFKDLGLFIVDEEQRFGVRAKEALKKRKVGVDCLTLSATPIPRTLYMSLVSARDMSLINTPPQDRLPIKSIIAENDLIVIQNALLREFARGGQAFFIHNRVESIFSRAETIGKLVPSARIGVVHGQMDSDEIDPVFHRFQNGEIDLLFATTIIENGIDIPNANTILIDRADTYGLADLYQLRGRVGRWNRAAYAYFLIQKNVTLSEIARKRLSALVEGGGYGGGMRIAMRDLEIRGAGDLLGVQQSGQVSSIGFHLYCKLLKRAIDALKKQAPISFNETKMEHFFDAKIPESYIDDIAIRMELYYRLGEAATLPDVDALYEEIKDRFGAPPEPLLWLYHLTRIRVFAMHNQFSLLKFQNVSLIAEQLVKLKKESHTILYPQKFSSPASFEAVILQVLKENFSVSEVYQT